MDNVEIVALCDIVPGRCEEAQAMARNDYGSNVLDNAKCYTDFEEFILQEDIEAVAKGMRENDIPCDSIYFDIDYMEGYRPAIRH